MAGPRPRIPSPPPCDTHRARCRTRTTSARTRPRRAATTTRTRSPAGASCSARRWRSPAACCSRARAAGTIPRVSDSVSTAIDTQWPIKRVIYVMLENRSFDNLFGKFPGVEKARIGGIGRQGGPARPLPRVPAGRPAARPGRLPERLGRRPQDGFGGGACGDPWAYTVHDAHQIAELLAVGEGVRASPTTSSRRRPGRRTRTTSSSSPASRAARSTTRRTSARSRPADGGTFKSWGCDAIGDGVFVFTKDEHGNLAKHDTCFTFHGRRATLARSGWTGRSTRPCRDSPATSGTRTTASTTCSTTPGYWNAHMRPVDADREGHPGGDAARR